MKCSRYIISLLIIALQFSSCNYFSGEKHETIDYSKAPIGFPPIPFPADNPYSKEKVELGRKLFYENMLTKDNEMLSCSHCFKFENAFTDNVRYSRGYGKQHETMNTMTLVNVAYRDRLFWDGRGRRIEGPAYRSLFLPMIFNSDTNEIAKKLSNDPEYSRLFQLAFGNDAKPSAFLVSKAIATFVRTIVSGNSKYDKYINGDKLAMNESEIRGMDLFFSKRTDCSTCHSGFMFTDMKFHCTGLSNHYFDRGRFNVTGDYHDFGKYLTPTLRNIEYTKPYMHDGTFNTIEDILVHYSHGGFPFKNRDSLIRPLNLTDTEKKDLASFLRALTDLDFLNNPRFAKPEH